jgi:hypothetical protein
MLHGAAPGLRGADVNVAARCIHPAASADPVSVRPAGYRPRRSTRLDIEGYAARTPGFGARYLQGLAVQAAARGWSRTETLCLIAAVEERMAVWLVRPRRLGRGALAERLPGGTGAACDAIREIALAGARGGIGLAAVSGRRAPAGFLRDLDNAGARLGRIDGGAAAELGVRWAVEVAIVPVLAPGALASLREQIAVAPRCGWCRVPVLGTSCRRCLGAGP